MSGAGLRRRRLALGHEPRPRAPEPAQHALGLGRDALLRRPAAAPAGSRHGAARRARRASAASGTSSRSRTGAFGQDGDAGREQASTATSSASLADELGGTGDAYFEALCRLRARRHGSERLGREDAAARLPDRRPARRVPGGEGRLPRPRPARGRRLVPRLARRGGAARRDRGGASSRPTASASRRSFNLVLMSLLWRGVVRASFAALAPARPRARADPALRAARRGARGRGARALRLARPRVRARRCSRSGSSTAPTRRRAQGVSTEPVDRWRQRLSPAGGRDRAGRRRAADGRARLRARAACRPRRCG